MIPIHLLNFANQNRNLNWSVNVNITNPINTTEWLFQQDDIGWLKLDLGFNLGKFKDEMIAAEPYYVSHRNGELHRGWSSCCIHGVSISETTHRKDISIQKFNWTELANKVPSVVNFWKNFPVQGFKRLRFMKLDPGGYIDIHNDLPDWGKHLSLKDLNVLKETVAVNLAITHPKECEMISEGRGTLPWQEGSIYILNNTRNHAIINHSDQPRVHMIAECIIGDRLEDFSNLIFDSLKGNNVISNI
jgi:hypothetical protein